MSHCVSSLLPESIDLNDMYAGYKNPTRSTTSFNPPTRVVITVRRIQAGMKKRALGTPVSASSFLKFSAAGNNREKWG